MMDDKYLRRLEACEEAINTLIERSLEHKRDISNCAAQILMNDKNIWQYVKEQTDANARD